MCLKHRLNGLFGLFLVPLFFCTFSLEPHIGTGGSSGFAFNLNEVY